MEMTIDDDRSGRRGIALDPADLDGHTFEELVDYIESGRTPRDDAIEGSAGCRLALDALERLHTLGADLLEADTAQEPPVDENWIQQVMSGIGREIRAGRRIPLDAEEDADLAITEGAVRGLIRDAERAVPAALIGRCRLEGDVTRPGEPIRVAVDVSVRYGHPIATTAGLLRAEIARRLEEHTDLVIADIDVTVHDVRWEPGEGHE
ncbi:hypothetical protein [Microbacterium resistens]